jgi:hypothetical protein
MEREALPAESAEDEESGGEGDGEGDEVGEMSAARWAECLAACPREKSRNITAA